MNGQTASEALVRLVLELDEIKWVEFLRLSMPPSVEYRPGATAKLHSYAELARAAQPPGDSFTESFIAIAEQHGDVESALLVVGYHQPLADAVDRIVLKRESLTGQAVDALIAGTASEHMLVVTSRVGTSAGTAHIPLLDFKLAAEESNVSVAKSVVRRSGGGLLVNSGSSFHMYGDYLINDDEMREWLLRAQLLSRCVDTRWVTHQLIEGKAALRLTKGGGRCQIPFVIERVGGTPPSTKSGH